MLATEPNVGLPWQYQMQPTAARDAIRGEATPHKTPKAPRYTLNTPAETVVANAVRITPTKTPTTTQSVARTTGATATLSSA